MRSFAHLDYLHLEADQTVFMKYFKADKCTQVDDELINNCPNSPNDVKQPPKRPPPPKITKSFDEEIIAVKVSPRFQNQTMSNRDVKLKKKFNTFKEQTMKWSKTMQRKMSKRPVKSKSVNEILIVNDTSPNETKTNVNGQYNSTELKKSDELIVSSSEIIYRTKSIEQIERCKSLSHKSAPPRITKSVSNVMSLDDLLIKNESIFDKFTIISLIVEFLNTDSSNENSDNYNQYVDQCLKVFVKTCRRQVKDIINDINDHFSYSLDLNSVGLISNQPEFFTIYCIPGWKQMRIIENNNTKEKFLSLKNSQYQSWILLNRKKPNVNNRWVCFPIYSINMLENEVILAENNDFQTSLLKMIMLTCSASTIENDNFPKNIDPNFILLVSSKCGIIVIFKECLNNSELFSLKLLECDSVEDFPEVFSKSKTSMVELISKFFHRTEMISILISSTWPTDYMALLLSELILDSE